MATSKKEKSATAAKKAAPVATLAITQLRSGCQAPKDQKACLKGIGLRRIRHTVVRQDTPEIRGMILKVRHLVSVAESAKQG